MFLSKYYFLYRAPLLLEINVSVLVMLLGNIPSPF